MRSYVRRITTQIKNDARLFEAHALGVLRPARANEGTSADRRAPARQHANFVALQIWAALLTGVIGFYVLMYSMRRITWR